MAKEKVMLEKCECGNMVHKDAPACFQCGKVASRRIYHLHQLWAIVFTLTAPIIVPFVLVLVFGVKEKVGVEVAMWLIGGGIVGYRPTKGFFFQQYLN